MKNAMLELVDADFGVAVNGSLMPAQKRLVKLLSSSDTCGRMALLLMLLWNCSGLPSEAESIVLLRWANVVVAAQEVCIHCRGEVFQIPSTLLGRLCRCCSVVAPQGCCTTALLMPAVTAPAAVEEEDRAVGTVEDACIQGSGVSLRRVKLCSVRNLNALCEFFS